MEITIKGTTYMVIERRTPDDEATAGNTLLAREMRNHDTAAWMYVRKQRGSVVYVVSETVRGQYTAPVRIG